MKQKIEAYLKAHNITFYKFCKDNGFNYSTAKNWLNETSMPSYENGRKLETILNEKQ